VSRELYEVTGAGYDPRGDILRDGMPAKNDDLALIAKVAVLCNDASSILPGESKVTGDPTEIALLVVAEKAGERTEKLRTTHQRIYEVPFSSERKRMTTVHTTPDGQLLYCMKGALESVLQSTESVYFQGRSLPMDEGAKQHVQRVVEKMAESALRVLAFAYKTAPSTQHAHDDIDAEKGLIFLGVMGMIDPPRDEVKDAVQECYAAGIKVVMITGDHKATATAVARELGLLKPGGVVLTGAELDRLQPEEFEQAVENITVYARVSPDHKLRIVNALKRRGHIVAMTGDGVNDAPALKNADIGVAMGITGTDVTKEAADIVLTDDNFASIVAAVEEGRAVYENIRKYLVFLLSANVGELLIMLSASVLGYPLPLVPVQILYVNLATDGLPALALGIDPPMQDLMRRRPRDPKLSIFAGLRAWTVAIAILLSSTAVALFAWGLTRSGLAEARSLVFASVILFELAIVFSCRSQNRTLFQIGVFSNKHLVVAVLSQIALLLVIVYTPSAAALFEVVPISAKDWPLVIAVGLSGFILAEAAKTVLPKFRRNRFSSKWLRLRDGRAREHWRSPARACL
jgi:Ca2+-transporting ATPase